MVGLLTVQDTERLQWTKELHQGLGGNVGLADGSVTQTSNSTLRKLANAQMGVLSNQPVRLVIP